MPNTLSHVVYYGTNRDMSAKDLQKYDVVITTYQTVVGEHNSSADEGVGTSKRRKKGMGSLFGVQWKVPSAHPTHSLSTRVDAYVTLARHPGRGS